MLGLLLNDQIGHIFMPGFGGSHYTSLCIHVPAIFLFRHRVKPSKDADVIGNSWARGYKTFFVLNSTEHEIYPAHKC